MNTKKGFEMSMNMIIIIILSLVFLGIAIGFVYKMMPTKVIDIPVKCDMYPPNADNPVCIDRELTFQRGQTIQLKVSFYNDENAEISATTLPAITCGKSIENSVLDLKVSTTGKKIPIRSYEDYLLLIQVPKDAVRTTYPCTLTLSEMQESFAVVVG